MRPLGAAVVGAIALAASAVSAEPVAAPGFKLEVLREPGAIFSGLARDGDALLATDLASGKLLRRVGEGKLVPFGPVFPHGLNVFGDPTGPYRVSRVGDRLLVAEGWTPVDDDEGPFDHALVAIDSAGAARVVSNDFWNPFNFVASGSFLYVVDAARNSVERIGMDGTGKTPVMSFARLGQSNSALQTLSPTEFKSDATYEVDAVPTGMAFRDGRLSVSLFGGFPYLAGTGRVVSFGEAGGEPQTDVSGLDAPVAVAWLGGHLLILEHGTFDQASGFQPGTGRLIAFDDLHGRREVILDGLTRPASVLVWDDRRIVVSTLGDTIYFLTRATAD